MYTWNRPLRVVVLSVVISLVFSVRGTAVPPRGAQTAQGESVHRRVLSTGQHPESGSQPSQASGFSAFGVTLLSHVSYTAFGGGSFESQDCWGYVSPSGREYAIIGNSHGVGFAEVTDPTVPVVIAEVPHAVSFWSDMKVHDEYCYAVNQNAGGLQVIDLRQIDEGIVVEAPANPREFSRAHNIALNSETGFAYPCGTDAVAGFIAYDLSDPADPKTTLSWFWNEEYVHDLHTVYYEHCPYGNPAASCEIGFASCGGAGLRIIDVTDKANMRTIASMTYPTLSYSHQSWTTEDRKFLLVDDEGDETGRGMTSTTYVWNVEDPSDPTLVSTFTNGLRAIDHNLYIRGDYMYAANYTSGFRLFDVSDPPNGQEVGYFDTSSYSTVSFHGAWGVYPFLPSGSVLVSDIEEGLFVLDVSQFTGCLVDLSCNDSNACTTDTCTADGSCSYVNTAAGTSCDDSDTNPCTLDTCDGAGTCTYTSAPAGASCDDRDANPCTSDTCDGAGTCTFADVSAGVPCDDRDPCTLSDACNGAGVCESTALGSIPCVDDSPCGGYSCAANGFCGCLSCAAAEAPVMADTQMLENRFLTVVPGNPGARTALRVVFASLAPPFDVFSGMSMWVGAPRVVSESGANVEPVEGVTNFVAATLECTPHFRDWASVGPLSVYHPAIVPGSEYHVGAISEACAALGLDSVSSFVAVETSRFGDVVDDLTFSPPGPPDGEVVIPDVLAVIGGFASVRGGARKTRTDMEPGTPDLLINISDVLVTLSAFSGVPFPFDPPTGPPPCP